MQRLPMRMLLNCMSFALVLVFSLVILLFVQAEELRKSFWEKSVPAKVYVGMRYWRPFIVEAIEQVSCHLYEILNEFFQLLISTTLHFGISSEYM